MFPGRAGFLRGLWGFGYLGEFSMAVSSNFVILVRSLWRLREVLPQYHLAACVSPLHVQPFPVSGSGRSSSAL